VNVTDDCVSGTAAVDSTNTSSLSDKTVHVKIISIQGTIYFELWPFYVLSTLLPGHF
jgi:hypothetical protein